MSDFDYGVDKHIYPFPLTSNNNKFYIEEATSTNNAVIEMGSGWWWTHNLSVPLADTSSHEGFLKAVQRNLNFASLGNDYEVKSSDPLDPTLNNAGLTIQTTGGGNNEGFTIEFNVSDGIDPRIFGFRQNRTTIGSGAQANPAVISPFSLLYQWQTWSYIGGKASDKTKSPQKRVELASDDQDRARAQKLNEIVNRNFTYKVLPGALVKKDRADDENAAARAGLYYSSGNNYGDTHNNFEHFWDHATNPGKNQKLPEVIVYHDQGDQDHITSDTSWETYRFSQIDQINSAEECISDHGSSSEIYNIEFETQIINSGQYNQ